MTSFSGLPDFIRGSNSIKTILEVGEQSPILKPQERGSPEILANPKQLYACLLYTSHPNFTEILTQIAQEYQQILNNHPDVQDRLEGFFHFRRNWNL